MAEADMGAEPPAGLKYLSAEPPADIPFEAVRNAWDGLAPYDWDWRKTPRVKGIVRTPALHPRRNPYEGVIVEFRLEEVLIRHEGEVMPPKARAVTSCGFIVAIDCDDMLTRAVAQQFVGRKFR